MKEKISGNNVEVRKKSDRVIAIVPTLCKKVIQTICAYGPPSKRLETLRKLIFIMKWQVNGT